MGLGFQADHRIVRDRFEITGTVRKFRYEKNVLRGSGHKGTVVPIGRDYAVWVDSSCFFDHFKQGGRLLFSINDE